MLAGWAIGTASLLPSWRSDDALWDRAVRVSPTARALLNFGIATRKAGDLESAVSLFVRADAAAARSPHPSDIRHRVRAQLIWIETFGIPDVCSRLTVRPSCY